jgi:putative transposase
MSRNYYSEINLHLVWHTKLSRPLLTADIEPMAWAALREKAAEIGGVVVHQIGGIETHVHLAVSIEPTLNISELVGALKGYAAHEVNRRAGMKQKVLEWQTGYGVVSFGTKDLPWVAAYIRGQKEHHARGATHERLERISRSDGAALEAEAEDPEAP